VCVCVIYWAASSERVQWAVVGVVRVRGAKV
jgi:hypothetical protein